MCTNLIWTSLVIKGSCEILWMELLRRTGLFFLNGILAKSGFFALCLSGPKGLLSLLTFVRLFHLNVKTQNGKMFATMYECQLFVAQMKRTTRSAPSFFFFEIHFVKIGLWTGSISVPDHFFAKGLLQNANTIPIMHGFQFYGANERRTPYTLLYVSLFILLLKLRQ